MSVKTTWLSLLALILALLMALFLGGCGARKTNEPTATEAPDPAKETVTIVIPAELLDDEDSGMTAGLEEGEEGVISATKNEDGSITYVMTKAKQQEILKDLADAIEESVLSLSEDEEEAPAVKKIEFAKDFSEFTLTIDQESASGFEAFYALALCMAGTNYQAFAGNGLVDVPAKLVDAGTGEVFSTTSYSELMDVFTGIFSGEEWETEPLIPVPEIEPAVLLDENGVVVTLTGITDDFLGTKLNVRIENGSEEAVTVDCDRMLVNDYSCSTSLYTNVAAGETAEGEMYIPVSDLFSAGAEYIGRIDLQMVVYDPETYGRIATGDLVEIRTSDYENNWQAEPKGTVIYEDNGLTIIFLEPQEEDQSSYWYQYNLCFINSTDDDFTVECESFAVNGCEMSTWVYKTIPAGKRAIDFISLYTDDLKKYEIEKPETLDMVFSVTDKETYVDLFSTGSIVIDLG